MDDGDAGETPQVSMNKKMAKEIVVPPIHSRDYTVTVKKVSILKIPKSI